MCESGVDLGFLEELSKDETWQLESYHFPSKFGGKPAWLDLQNIPREINCGKCQNPMIFLCQVFAALGDDHNFHRSLFVFICRNGSCCQRNNSDNIKVFRSSIQRRNEFYPYEPPEDGFNSTFRADNWIKLCNLCGCYAEKHCSKCKKVYYCTREHQISDWKSGHKNECGSECTSRTSPLLFPEYLIDREVEDIDDEEPINETEELQKFEKLVSEGKSGTMSQISTADMEQHAHFDKDKTFTRFRKHVNHYPEQIMRYQRNGEPLWVADEPKPESVPNCENCNSPRRFEFQIMPQTLSLIKEDSLDWGVLVIYTCSKSCKISGYISEFVYKQDITQ